MFYIFIMRHILNQLEPLWYIVILRRYTLICGMQRHSSSHKIHLHATTHRHVKQFAGENNKTAHININHHVCRKVSDFQHSRDKHPHPTHPLNDSLLWKCGWKYQNIGNSCHITDCALLIWMYGYMKKTYYWYIIDITFVTVIYELWWNQ